MQRTSGGFCQFASNDFASMFLAELAIDIGQLLEAINVVVVHIGEVYAFAVAISSKSLTNDLSALADGSVFDQK